MAKPTKREDPRGHAIAEIAQMAPTGEYARAQKALESFPDTNPLIVDCWLWSRGGIRSRPSMKISPLYPMHPVRIFFGAGIKRICTARKCVNPWHFIEKPYPPTQSRPPAVEQAEDELEARKPKSLLAAYNMLEGSFYKETILLAYRNLRQSGHL